MMGNELPCTCIDESARAGWCVHPTVVRANMVAGTRRDQRFTCTSGCSTCWLSASDTSVISNQARNDRNSPGPAVWISQMHEKATRESNSTPG